MFELLFLLTCVLLAKHKPKGRRRYSLRPVRITPELVLSTLGAATVLKADFVGNSDSQYRLISAIGTWTIRGLTAGEGPITVGVAHNDYTVAEIAEALVATNAISQGDKIANERSKRLVRIIGTFGPQGPGNLDDGRPIKTRLNWLFPVGERPAIFAFNDSGSALTTGASVHFMGTIYVKDAT